MSEEKLTSKEKIDKMLGIQSDQSIDDFLDNLTADVDKLSATVGNMSDEFKQNLQTIDNGIEAMKKNEALAPTVLVDINSSMKEVEDLVCISKKMYKHVYESIICSDLIDSELISAASKLLESIHVNIAEFLTLYKDKQRYIDKIKIMTFQHQLKLELMEKKHKQDMEKAALKLDTGAVDGEATIGYSQEDMTRMLAEMQEKAEAEEAMQQ